MLYKGELQFRQKIHGVTGLKNQSTGFRMTAARKGGEGYYQKEGSQGGNTLKSVHKSCPNLWPPVPEQYMWGLTPTSPAKARQSELKFQQPTTGSLQVEVRELTDCENKLNQ